VLTDSTSIGVCSVCTQVWLLSWSPVVVSDAGVEELRLQLPYPVSWNKHAQQL
jgi:hypothetical protein